MEIITKLQIGIKAYYDGEVYDYETGNLIEEEVINLGLTLEEYNLCLQWLGHYSDYHQNDTVIYGCDCGCGGDSMDIEDVDYMEEFALGEMQKIEDILGEPPLGY